MSQAKYGAKNDAYLSLDKSKQRFIQLDFTHQYSNKEITEDKDIQIKRVATISDWRASSWYKPAHDAYVSSLIKHKYKDGALKTLFELLKAKSEKVRLQAAASILKLAGMFLDNSTPELDRAKTRKAIAEAKIAESQAKQLQALNDSSDQSMIIDDLSDGGENDNDSDSD